MSNTEHYNLPQIPTGAVDWASLINAAFSKIETGRTVKVTAGEPLTKGDPFYISNDTSGPRAYKADDTVTPRGVWYSASTNAEAEGYGQIEGTMEDVAWSWIPGADLYVNGAGELTEDGGSPPTTSIGWALSATEIVIKIGG